MLDILRQEGVKDVIHLGDLFDRRKYLNFVTASKCRQDFLDPLNELGKIHIIAGNHDEFYTDSHEVNSLREIVMGRYDNISIYTTPTDINIGGLDILLLPWITQSNYERSIDALRDTKSEIIMGHLDLVGFEERKGSFSTHGMEAKTFEKFDTVFSGHFHHQSIVGNIHYLGAFTEHSWADYNDPRGFHILDTETRQTEFYDNPYTMFQMISYDDAKDKDIISTIKTMDFTHTKNTYVKIVCSSKTNPYAFDTMFDKLYKAGPINISVVEDISTFADNEETTEIDQAEETSIILGKYIDGLTLDVDRDRMKAIMHSIYTEALTMDETV